MSSSAVRPGGVCFVAADECGDACAQLKARRYLVAVAEGASRPGELRRAVEDAVEAALANRGALPPGVDLEASAEATMRDQLFRARLLGVTGVAIALPAFQDAEAGDRTINREDGAVISTWMAAAQRDPVVLLLDESARDARVLLPTRLVELAGPIFSPFEDAPAASVLPGDEAELEAPPPIAPRAAVATAIGSSEPSLLDGAEVDACAQMREQESSAAETNKLETATRRVLGVMEARGYAVDLDKARGPKPIKDIERLFATRYMPLLSAIARGDADTTVKGVVDAWRTNFEHSYREAFSAMRVTGRRPPMVFDVPEIAAKIARLNGARMTKLLLVDAMRFDLGTRIADCLAQRLASRAICVDRTLVWAAIPTTTTTQTRLLGQGLDGLLEAASTGEPEPEIVRGRMLGTLRRERYGSREVMKLDVVEARLRTSGGSYDDRIDGLTDEVSQTVVRYVDTLPPRTLLLVFGDHGFRLPTSLDGRSSGAATQGGATPEEVLVLAHAWLIGGVH